MRSARRLFATGLATFGVLAGGLMFAGAPAFASLGHRLLSQITEVPANPAEPSLISGPVGSSLLALNAGGDLYAVAGQQGIDKFNSAGDFLSQFGAGVLGINVDSLALNEHTGEVYAGDNQTESVVDVFNGAGELLGAWKGEDTPTHSFGTGQIRVAVDNSADPADPDKGDVYVADENAGVVYAVDPEAGGKEKYLFQLSNTFGSIGDLTVDQTNGDFLVVGGGGIDILEPEARDEYKLLAQIAGPPGGTFGDITQVATDGVDGDIYVSDRVLNVVDEFSAAGAYLGQISGPTAGPFQEPVPFQEPRGVAVGPNEDVYVSSGGVDVFGPNIVFPDVSTGEFLFPSVQQTSATVEGTLNPEGIEHGTSYFFQYGTSPAFGSSTPAEGPEEGTTEKSVSATLNGLREDTTYYYRLVVEAEGEHHLGAIRHVTTLPAAPVTYSTAQTTATVEGTVDTQDLPTSYWFEYGSSEAYGQRTPELSVAGSLAGVPVAQILDELLPVRTYHYRFVSKNALGTTYSPDETATTESLRPPTVSTGGASNVSQSSGTLSGTVDTQSLQTEYGFEIGTEPGNYGPATGLGSIGGTAAQTVSVTLGELQPATTYYYRITATNADGTSYGESGSFTTPGFPTLLVTPSSLPLVATPQVAFPIGSLANTGTAAETKTLTNAEKLSKALQACRKDKRRARRVSCETAARRKYAPASRKKGATKKK